jgi:thiamine biosynthesis protein ThiI
MDIIAHFDEIFLKGHNQNIFVRRLSSNLEALFKNTQIKRIESGLWIGNFPGSELDRLALIPGIANFAIAFSSKSNLDDLIRAVLKVDWGQAKTFRIRCERSYKNFPFNSAQVEKAIGAAVNEKFGYKVQLKDPELTIHISIGKDQIVFFGNTVEGAGGLPIGTAGRVLALISGGIDSPVAAYKMMVRGAVVDLVHFQNETRVTQEVAQKIFDLAKVLARYQGSVNLHIVPFDFFQRQIVMKVKSDYRMLSSRRLFLKIASIIAAKHGYQALILGDSLGQVASQTLENLNSVYESSPMLKFSPLIALNKVEITAWSRRLGLFEISSRPYADCCSLFLSAHPQTKSDVETLRQLENNLDLSTLDKVPYISYHIGME